MIGEKRKRKTLKVMKKKKYAVRELFLKLQVIG